MKSLPTLSAVMFTTMFFLCSTMLFDKISSQNPATSSTGLPSSTGSPSSTGRPTSAGLTNTSNQQNEHSQHEEDRQTKQNKAHVPNPMFNAIFPKGNPSQMVEAKVKIYEGRVEQVKNHGLVNDASTTEGVSNGTGDATGSFRSVSVKVTPTGSVSGPKPSSSEAPLKQPRSLTLRYAFGGTSGFLLFVICILLCWEQCCQSPHY
ncbi:hypothetical protein Mgra_00002390 [Meloidogyne graminicola]|uniref:Transmembrane protein n=1 Tax=Meloidogyne graminicola TaxID=189291 RepID=A0A8S9ZWP6_9BILA|nr:hypothetical protein Mgra_00002390 [Meloidogyne graminicola]